MHSFPWGYSMSLWWTYRDWKWESHLYMLYIATDILCSHCDFITLLYPSTKLKSCVKSNIMKCVNVVLNIKPSVCGINKGTWSEVTGLWNCFWQAYKNWKAHSQESYWVRKKCLQWEVCIRPTLYEGAIHSRKRSKMMIVPTPASPFLRMHCYCIFERKQNLPQCSTSFLLELQLEEGWAGGPQGDGKSSSPSYCWDVHPCEHW